ncbi:hypothetical protein [Lysinibacillus fusiformis]|uniref:hypothetical protein n=1 Tax=Lysinibacillus fusiformis TaxID=28031 RepID=UPI0011AB0291|nr:hypothetical protein [Lysinibacillus fusiformis]
MSKIITKLSSLALATAVIGSGFSVNASAAEALDSNEFKNEVVYETQENVGVNDVEPGLGEPNVIVPFGTSKPTSTWDLSTQGRYPFSGSANSAVSLYTNYLLTGKSSVKIYVRNNDHQYSLKFKVKRKDLVFDNTIGSYELALGKDTTINLSFDKSSNYYIEFSGPNNFSGHIE